MTTVNITTARKKIYQLIKEVTNSHAPVIITGKNANAILISESDWTSIQETLYLLSIPGMRESIKKGLATKVADCSMELDW
ncbi:MAG: type II toxin-antitoxin system Phd/YefM family antitoxin [Candidatus Aminicenantes bacterium]|nr:type II toxin-antitoxin system Phd/YefM family antitoxin [Candidatus Aminicenantes bacterium]